MSNAALGSANSDTVPLPVPIQPRQHRNRRVHRIPHKTLSVAKMREMPAEPLEPEDYQLLDDNRPRCRADCRDNGLRPCPFVGCRHNLYLDIAPDGAIELARPELEPDDMEFSCVLDLVEGSNVDLVGAAVRSKGGIQRIQSPDGPVWSFVLEVTAVLVNLTRERVRQIEKEALAKLRGMRELPRPVGVDEGEGRSVCKLAKLQLFMGATGAKAQIVHHPGEGTGPKLELTCSKCGKEGARWFEGWTLTEVRVMAGVISSQPSDCCDAPVTSRLTGLPAQLNRRNINRERERRLRIQAALDAAGSAGLSGRQLRAAVPGRFTETLIVARRMAKERRSRVRVERLAPGEPERFFSTVPEPRAPVAT